MPTYIDESGDPGNIPGASRYFRLAAVWVPSLEDATTFENRAQALRKRLGLPEAYEFKHAWTDNLLHRRRAFLEVAKTLEFRFVVSHIDKHEPDWAQACRREILRACATDLAANLRQVYYQAERSRHATFREPIIVDDNKDREYLHLIKTQFRAVTSQDRPGQSMIGRVNFRSSAWLTMLQLADMVCGLTGEIIEGKDSGFYQQIADRDLNAR